MKQLLWIMMLLLTGCAGIGYYPPATYSPASTSSPAMTLEQVTNIKVIDSRDCPNIDNMIALMDKQLTIKGLTYSNPEDLNPEDRRYNATVRIVKWSLIIGCNNPHRYDKK